MKALLIFINVRRIKMADKNICTACKKLIEKEGLTLEGKKFCCKKCCDRYEHRNKNICEFC
jgi:hypothetical protein